MLIFGEKIKGGGVKGAQKTKKKKKKSSLTDKLLFIFAKYRSSVGMDGSGSHFP